MYLLATRIVVLSPGFKKMLSEAEIPTDRITVIFNWCDEDALKPDGAVRTKSLISRFAIVFAGTMGRVQALDAVLDAAARLETDYPDIRFVFVGGGVEVDRLQQRVRNSGLSNVIFLPARPMSEIGAILTQAAVLLVHLKDDPLFEITIPSKTQAYMAMGKPILMAVRGDAADLVREADAGVCCLPQNPRSIADAAIELYKMPSARLEQMGRNALDFYENRLSERAGVEAFVKLFKEILNVAS